MGKTPREIVQKLGAPLERTDGATGIDGGLAFALSDRQIVVEFRDFKAVVVRVKGTSAKPLNAMTANSLLGRIGGTTDWAVKEASPSLQRWESKDGGLGAEFLIVRGELIVVSKKWQEMVQAASTLEGMMNPPKQVSQDISKKAEQRKERLKEAMKSAPKRRDQDPSGKPN